MDGALGTANCRVSSKVPVPKVCLGEALGLLVRLLFHASLQTLNLVAKRNRLFPSSQPAACQPGPSINAMFFLCSVRGEGSGHGDLRGDSQGAAALIMAKTRRSPLPRMGTSAASMGKGMSGTSGSPRAPRGAMEHRGLR